MTGPNDNERDYFRVDCRAIVATKDVGGRIPAGRNAESYFGEDQFDLLRELRRLDLESAGLLQQLNDQDRTLGGFLHVINRKVDALARHLTMLSPELRDGAEQTISISEGGIAFVLAVAPEEGTLLALRVMMLPSGTAFAAFGRVVKRVARESGALVNVNFENLQEAERQLIARHVMQVQMAEQRRRSGRT